MHKEIDKETLIVEIAPDDSVWGHCHINGNMIVDVAPDLDTLKQQMTKVVWEIKGVKVKEWVVEMM